MSKIPSLRTLCLIKFPIKEVMEDRKLLLEFLSYPNNIVADILQKGKKDVNTKKEFFFAVNNKFQFYLVRKRTYLIMDGEQEKIISDTFYTYYYYHCLICAGGSKYYEQDKLKAFCNKLGQPCACCQKDYKIEKMEEKEKKNCTETIQKNRQIVIEILKKEMNKNELSKSFIMRKRLCGQLLYIFTEEFTKKLFKKLENKSLETRIK